MSGIDAYFWIEQRDGFMLSDGMTGKDLEIRVCAGNREWLEASYINHAFQPMSMSLKSFVPCAPRHEDTPRIAMILFASNLFETCPSFDKVKREMDQIKSIDFDTGHNVPPHFYDLLEESRSIDINEKVNIYFAKVRYVSI